MSYDAVMIHIAFLKFFRDDVFTRFLIFHMHNRIMEIRIKFLAYRFDRFYTDPFLSLIHI